MTLTGTVLTDSAHLEAYKLATQTPGVVKSTTKSRVAQPQPPAPSAAAAPAPPAAETEAAHLTRKQRRELAAKERREREKQRQAELAAARAQRPPSQVASNQNPSEPPSQSAADNSVAGEQVAQDTAPPQNEPVPPPPPPAAADGCDQPSAPPPPPLPPPTKQVEIAAGTTVTIRMIDGIDSSVNKAGEVFHASLEAPLVSGDSVVVRKGAEVSVRLTDADSAGKFAGKSELHLELVRLQTGGKSYPLVSSTYSLAGSSRGQDTAKKVGGGAVVGAISARLRAAGKARRSARESAARAEASTRRRRTGSRSGSRPRRSSTFSWISRWC